MKSGNKVADSNSYLGIISSEGLNSEIQESIEKSYGDESSLNSPLPGGMIESLQNQLQSHETLVTKRPKFIFRSSSSWHIRWDLLIIFLALYNTVSIPFFVSFGEDNVPTVITLFEWVIDGLFVLDILINFRSTFVNHNGEEIFNPKTIAKHYGFSLSFLIDLLAVVPFELIPALVGLDLSNKNLRLLQILKMVRLLRLRRIITYLKFKTDFKLGLRIVMLITTLFLFVHIVGCFWYMIVYLDEKWIPPKDITFNDLFYGEEELSYNYAVSVYYATLMLLGADVMPYDVTQTIYCCIMLLIGSIVTAALLGHMTVLVQSLNRKTAKYHEELDTANQAMKNLNLPNDIQSQVIEYISYTYSNRDQQDELNKFFEMISPSLKFSVLTHLYKEVLESKCVLIISQEALEFIINKLSPVLSIPEETIVKQGDSGKVMYFVAHGDLSVLLWDSEAQEVKKVIGPGSYFGEISLLSNSRRTASVVSNNYCTIAEFNSEDFNELVERFPGLKSDMIHIMHNYEDEWHNYLIKLLRKVPFLENCTRVQLSEIAYNLKYQTYEAGSKIVERGDKIDYIMIVVSGELELLIHRRSEEVFPTLKIHKGGICFVESSVMNFKQLNQIKTTKSSLIMKLTGRAIEIFSKKFLLMEKDLNHYKKQLESEKFKDDFILEKKSHLRVNRNFEKLKVTVLKMRRAISVRREKEISSGLKDLFNAVDQLIERKKDQEKESTGNSGGGGSEGGVNFENMLKQILSTTSVMANKLSTFVSDPNETSLKILRSVR